MNAVMLAFISACYRLKHAVDVSADSYHL